MVQLIKDRLFPRNTTNSSISNTSLTQQSGRGNRNKQNMTSQSDYHETLEEESKSGRQYFVNHTLPPEDERRELLLSDANFNIFMQTYEDDATNEVSRISEQMFDTSAINNLGNMTVSEMMHGATGATKSNISLLAQQRAASHNNMAQQQ